MGLMLTVASAVFACAVILWVPHLLINLIGRAINDMVGIAENIRRYGMCPCISEVAAPIAASLLLIIPFLGLLGYFMFSGLSFIGLTLGAATYLALVSQCCWTAWRKYRVAHNA